MLIGLAVVLVVAILLCICVAYRVYVHFTDQKDYECGRGKFGCRGNDNCIFTKILGRKI